MDGSLRNKTRTAVLAEESSCNCYSQLRGREFVKYSKNLSIISQKTFSRASPASGCRAQQLWSPKASPCPALNSTSHPRGWHFPKSTIPALHFSICCPEELSPDRDFPPMRASKDYQLSFVKTKDKTRGSPQQGRLLPEMLVLKLFPDNFPVSLPSWNPGVPQNWAQWLRDALMAAVQMDD